MMYELFKCWIFDNNFGISTKHPPWDMKITRLHTFSAQQKCNLCSAERLLLPLGDSNTFSSPKMAKTLRAKWFSLDWNCAWWFWGNGISCFAKRVPLRTKYISYVSHVFRSLHPGFCSDTATWTIRVKDPCSMITASRRVLSSASPSLSAARSTLTLGPTFRRGARSQGFALQDIDGSLFCLLGWAECHQALIAWIVGKNWIICIPCIDKKKSQAYYMSYDCIELGWYSMVLFILCIQLQII